MGGWTLQKLGLGGLSLLALAIAQGASAQNVVNVPSSPPLSIEQERQVQRLGAKIHCPICSGESIAQSQTDISRQMMNQVRELLRQGFNEQQILDRFKASYGERILLEPPRQGVNVLLWGLPVGFLLLGGGLWWAFLHRASRSEAQSLSPEDEQRIEALLAERVK